MDINQDKINLIKNSFNVEEIVAKILVNNGFDTIDSCDRFLHPDFKNLTNVFDYSNVDKIVDRINDAIDNSQTVVIYGDYDCDGVCSTAMLYLYFKSKGLDVHYYIPDRRDDGYGLSTDTLEYIADNIYPDLLITVDCGITSYEQVKEANETLGIDVIVLDHHIPDSTLPECLIFNPHLETCNQFKDLCGCGVVLRLIEALDGFENSLQYYDIAAIATVADVVPLIEDNRVIVSYGLKLLSERKRIGLRILIDSFAKKNNLTSYDIAFNLAPRLNAMGRLDNSNSLIDLFNEEDVDFLTNLVEELNTLNEKRKNITLSVQTSIDEYMDEFDFEANPVIVIENDTWDEGVVGIAASKVVEKYNHPVILFTAKGDLYKGSGRSIEGFDLIDCVRYASEYCVSCGGHVMACGVSVQKSKMDLFKQAVNQYAKNKYSFDLYKEKSRKSYDFKEITNINKTVLELEMLQPFGANNVRPLFKIQVNALPFSRVNTNNYDVITCKGRTLELIAFNKSDYLTLLASETSKTLTIDLSIKTFRNIETIQGNISRIDVGLTTDIASVDNYIKTSWFGKNSIFNPKCINFDDAKNLVKDNFYSTLFIAYDLDTFNNFNLINVDKNMFVNRSNCPNNLIIYNPYENLDFSKYKNIVFLDKPINFGFIDYMNINKFCKIFYIENDVTKKVLSKYLVSYTELGSLFVNIKNVLTKHDKMREYDLVTSCKFVEADYTKCLLAVSIFLELGILTIDDNKVIKIDNSVNNRIANSSLYRTLTE